MWVFVFFPVAIGVMAADAIGQDPIPVPLTAIDPAGNSSATDIETPRRGIEFVDFDAAPPAPAEFTLEDRIRQLEQQFSVQQSEAELLRNRLAEISTANEKQPDPKSFKAGWKNQLTFESADKNFTAHIGGRTQIDTIWLQDSAAFGVGNGAGDGDAVDFRRARFRMEGTMYKTVEYTYEYDFVNSVNDNVGLQPASSSNVINVAVPTDLYWTFHEIAWVGNVRVGNQKEPIGLEHLTSSRFLDFMERSFNQDAYTGPFNNGFTPGVSIYNNFGEDKRGLWQVGVFKNIVNGFTYGIGDGGYAVDGRLAYLLWDECEGRRLLHLAGSYSHRDPLNDAIRIRSRASLRNGPGALNPLMVETGNFLADSQDMLAAEMAMVLGSFQLQSEYIVSSATNARDTANTVNYGTYLSDGYYVMASYFLTGEHREYEKKSGAFGRVVPHQNSHLFSSDCGKRGWGAWQILARYSSLNLNDGALQGGQVADWTLGINWFLNPNMKIQANYVYTDRNSLGSPTSPGAGVIHGFGMRLAHDF